MGFIRKNAAEMSRDDLSLLMIREWQRVHDLDDEGRRRRK